MGVLLLLLTSALAHDATQEIRRAECDLAARLSGYDGGDFVKRVGDTLQKPSDLFCVFYDMKPYSQATEKRILIHARKVRGSRDIGSVPTPSPTFEQSTLHFPTSDY